MFIDGNNRECRFQPGQVEFRRYGGFGFWITKTEPIRLGWTGKFPKDDRFTLTIKDWSENKPNTMEKLLQHLCRMSDEDSPIVNEDDKFWCSCLVESLRKDSKGPGKQNAILWALVKKYEK